MVVFVEVFDYCNHMITIPAPAPRLDAARVQAMTNQLQSEVDGLSDTERVDLLRALEALACAAAGAQAVLTADFDASQRADQAAHGVPTARLGRGVAAQVALARRESPHRGHQHLGLAKVLTAEMPHTLAALRAGRITEWRATLLARETACLSLVDRRQVDQRLAGNPEHLEALGDGELVRSARALAYQLDPGSFVARRARAEADRRVTLRPAPEVMTHLSGLLPVKDGVAVHAALSAAADRARAAGDPRTRGQLMADTLIARILGTSPAIDVADLDPAREPRTRVGIELGLIVSDQVLFGASHEAAHLDGYGPIPADLARDLVADALDLDALEERCRVWLRRLYANPATGTLTAMDSIARAVPAGLGRYLRARDRFCRHPWCGAPIRHHDHVQAVSENGPTSGVNTQGLCEDCNYAKQAPGWHARPDPGSRVDPRHTLTITTPTGHSYHSTAPPAREPRYLETQPGVWTLIA
jgi:hypothetical protein